MFELSFFAVTTYIRLPFHVQTEFSSRKPPGESNGKWALKPQNGGAYVWRQALFLSQALLLEPVGCHLSDTFDKFLS